MQGFDVYTKCGTEGYIRTAKIPFEHYTKIEWALQLVDCPWDESKKVYKVITSFAMTTPDAVIYMDEGAILTMQ